MNILVTGGAGFLGSHIAEALLVRGHSVTVLDDLSGGFERNVPRGAHFVKGSVCNHALIRTMFKAHSYDAVYHLAAYAAEGLSHFIRRYNYENNVLGSVNLINGSIENRSVKKFVFTSSIAVYGHGGACGFKESDACSPIDPYGAAKLAVENDLRAAAEMFGLNYTIFRPHNIYAERQNIGDKYRNVVGIFMNQTLCGEPLTIFGDGSQKRAFSYVSDVVAPMVDCLRLEACDYATFNVGGRQPYTVLQLAEAVQRVSGVNTGIVFLEPRNEAKIAYCDHARVDRIFGVKPSMQLEEGLARMWEWAKKLGPQEPTTSPEIEAGEYRLPPSWRHSTNEIT